MFVVGWRYSCPNLIVIFRMKAISIGSVQYARSPHILQSSAIFAGDYLQFLMIHQTLNGDVNEAESVQRARKKLFYTYIVIEQCKELME